LADAGQPGHAGRALAPAIALLLVLVVCPANAPAQSPPVEASGSAYVSLLDNTRLHAFRLELLPSASTPVHAADHDQVWVAISSARLALQRADGRAEDAVMAPGMPRFFPAQQIREVTNQTGASIELIVVEFKQPTDSAQGCECVGVVARTVCGCRGALRLPPFWAMALGRVTLSGTTLYPGQSCPGTVPRGDSLLIAITPLRLSYAVAEDGKPTAAPAEVSLQPGDVTWLRAGRHQLVNTGESAGHFVSIELD
jgi:hypothetical protein